MERVRADARDLVLRLVAPASALWVLVIGIGLVVTGPLAGPLTAEDSLNRALVAGRGGPWDTAAGVWSFLGNTEMVIAACVLICAPLLWFTRDWRLAAVPALAIVLQLAVYLGVTAVIHRERPSVDRLETLPPMSSFPSGHVGASTALCAAVILLSSRIERVGLRWATRAVCIAVPLMVAFGRLFRGVHHVTDILAGLMVGASCALVSYGWYRHHVRASTASHLRAAAPDSQSQTPLSEDD